MKIIIYMLFLRNLFSQLGPTYELYNLDSIVLQNNLYLKKFSHDIVNGRIYKVINNRNIFLGRISKGLKIAVWNDWYSNGMKKEEVNFLNGMKNGLNTSWNSTGYRNWIKYFKEDKKDSLWIYYNNGIKTREEIYEKESLKSIKMFYFNGEIMSEGYLSENLKIRGSFIEERSRIHENKIIKAPALVFYKDKLEKKILWFNKETFNYINKPEVVITQDCVLEECLNDYEIEIQLNNILKMNKEELMIKESEISIEQNYLDQLEKKKKNLIITKKQIDSIMVIDQIRNKILTKEIDKIVKELKIDSFKNIKSNKLIEKRILENKFLEIKRNELNEPVLIYDYKSYNFSFRRVNPLIDDRIEIIFKNKSNVNLRSVNFFIVLLSNDKIVYKSEYYFKDVKKKEIRIQFIESNVRFDVVNVIPFD